MGSKAKRTLFACLKRVLLILLTLVMFFPLYIVFIMGTYYSENIFKGLPFLPSNYFLQNFQTVIINHYFSAFWNSMVVSTISVLLSVIVSSMIGFALAKYQFRLKGAIFSLVIMIMMVPQQVSLIGYVLEMRAIGINNTLLPLIFTWVAYPFGAFLMTQFMKDSVPTELLESAQLDGCTEIGLFFKIAIPAVKPGFLTLSTLVFLSSWNSYMLPLVIVNKQELFTIPLMVSTLSNSFRSDYGAIMCALSLSVLPMIVAFCLCAKTFIKGIAAGAVKE